jgi:hypothetical protein
MVRSLRAKDITVSELRGRIDLRILFEDNAMVDMLGLLTNTEVGKRPTPETNKCDSWNIERLDRSGDEESGAIEDGGCSTIATGKLGGPEAQKLWRLVEVGIASRIAWKKTGSKSRIRSHRSRLEDS